MVSVCAVLHRRLVVPSLLLDCPERLAEEAGRARKHWPNPLFLLAHNPKVAVSNPAPATKFSTVGRQSVETHGARGAQFERTGSLAKARILAAISGARCAAGYAQTPRTVNNDACQAIPRRPQIG